MFVSVIQDVGMDFVGEDHDYTVVGADCPEGLSSSLVNERPAGWILGIYHEEYCWMIFLHLFSKIFQIQFFR